MVLDLDEGLFLFMQSYSVGGLYDAWQEAQIRIMRIVPDVASEQEAHRKLGQLENRATIGANIEVIRNDRSPLDLIVERSGATADWDLLGMPAASGEEFRQFLQAVEPALQRLPTTVLIASNGEADVFV